MQDNHKNYDNEPLGLRKVLYLIESLGNKVNPPLDRSSFVKAMADYIVENENPNIKEPEKTVLRLLSGGTKDIRSKMRIRLEGFFRQADERVSREWFKNDVSFEDFCDACAPTSPRLSLALPEPDESILEQFKKHFCGRAFVSYRYSFGGVTDKRPEPRIARELLVFAKDSETFEFNYYIQVDQPKRYPVCTGRGSVVGMNLHLFGCVEGNDAADPPRLRHMVLRNEPDAHYNCFRFGVLLSSTPNSNAKYHREPVAAKVWLSEIVGHNAVFSEEEIGQVVKFIDGSQSLDTENPFDNEFRVRGPEIAELISNVGLDGVLLADTKQMNIDCQTWTSGV